MLGFLKKADKAVEWLQLVFCSLIMISIMCLTFCMVFYRYVLNNSIVWAEEILRYLMMWVVLVGAGLTVREDQHVSMDILQNVFKRWPKLRAIYYAFTRIVVFAFMIYLIGPTMDLITRAGNSTATSVTWLHKSVIYFSFICGIISVNLSLLGQVPRKIYAILHNIEDDKAVLELQEKAEEYNCPAGDGPDDAGELPTDGGEKDDGGSE